MNALQRQRRHRIVPFCWAFTLVLISATLAAGQSEPPAEYGKNWPKWRGPLGTGEAPHANPPTTWDGASGKNVKWKVEIPGSGTATPIIWNDQIFIQTAIPAAASSEEEPAGRNTRGQRRGGSRAAQPTNPYQFVLMCLDRQSGETLWSRVANEQVPHEGHHPDHGFASSSPVTDGEHVFAFFGSRGLFCFDLEGNLKWQKDLGDMQTRNGFGEGSSPALFGNTLVVNWDHEGDDFVVALDKHTGDELWRRERDEPTTWSTPLIVQHGGRAQVVIAATNRVISYDLESGETVWEGPGLTTNAIPSPVANDEMVFVTSGFRGSALFAIRLGHTGNLADTDAIAWSLSKSTPYVPSPLLYQDRLYFFASNNNVLSAYNARSGEPVIETQRIEGLQGVYASPVAAAGRVYLVGRNGVTAVLRHADQLEVIATNELGEPVDASPALYKDQLFLRSNKHLYCIVQQQE